VDLAEDVVTAAGAVVDPAVVVVKMRRRNGMSSCAKRTRCLNLL
jgi:hypothetical protein